MSFLSKIGKALKKVASPIVKIGSAVGVPGFGLVSQLASTAQSYGENRNKMRAATQANLKTPIVKLSAAPVRVSAPKRITSKVSLAPTKAEKARTAVRADQALKIKAGKVSKERQQLLAEEWKALGKPGTWEEYLLDQVRTGAIS